MPQLAAPSKRLPAPGVVTDDMIREILTQQSKQLPDWAESAKKPGSKKSAAAKKSSGVGKSRVADKSSQAKAIARAARYIK
jgi:hypothetical protein